jgi:hypothetical protein
MATAIETRRDLARYLQDQMAASRRNWLANTEDDEDTGRTMVKTYLVEAHCDANEDTLSRLSTQVGVHVNSAKEPGLFRLVSRDVEFWCDTSMGRFWQLHTVAPVKEADRIRDELVSAATWLDKVWLPPDYLERLAEVVGARLLLFSLNHDRRPLSRESFAAPSDFVSMRLWSSHAQETLTKLRNAEVFPHGVSIRSVRLHSGSEEPDGDFCVAEYFYHGKITANGTSFDQHSQVVVRVLRDYRRLVEGFESRFGLAAVSDGGHPVVAGDPIVINVDWTVADLEYAVARMFSSTDPFRLWGLPERLSDDRYRARAVDLHVGGVLTFDISRKHVVIQLPRGVCGNTVVRFLNNLHFHVNSDATAA